MVSFPKNIKRHFFFLGYTLFVLALVPFLININLSFQIFKFDMFSHSGESGFYDFSTDGGKSFLIREKVLANGKVNSQLIKIINSGNREHFKEIKELNEVDFLKGKVFKIRGDKILSHFFCKLCIHTVYGEKNDKVLH